MDEELIKKIRETIPESIANELLSVQPMPSNAVKELYDNSLSQDQLKEQGYEPVSQLGLMWVKKDKE